MILETVQKTVDPEDSALVRFVVDTRVADIERLPLLVRTAVVQTWLDARRDRADPDLLPRVKEALMTLKIVRQAHRQRAWALRRFLAAAHAAVGTFQQAGKP